MSHRNARLTVHGRILLIQRHRAKWKQAHIASAIGVSRTCVKHWIDRFESEGEAGLHDRSSRPHTSPARTVSRILRRHEVPYLRELDPMAGQLIRSPKATAIRYEREAPGELVHMDVKKLGRIPDGGGRHRPASPGSSGS